MARSVLHPRFGLTVGERDGDERGARVVSADLLTRLGAFEQDSAIDAGCEKMLAVPRSGVVDVDAFAVQVDENEVGGLGGDTVIAEKDAPCAEPASNAG